LRAASGVGKPIVAAKGGRPTSITAAVSAGPSQGWAKRIREMPQQQLFSQYPREAKIHRELIIARAPMASTWRQFRQFMTDVGACPQGEGWVLSVKDDRRRVYEPGKVAWVKAEDPAALYWTPNKNGQEADWNRLPQAAAKTSAVSAPSPRPIVVDEGQLFAADGAQHWLPPDPAKQELFKKAFRAWRAQVKPQFKKAATPAFLFLYTTVLVLRDLRNELDAEGLWNLHSARQHVRDSHPTWIKYCDHIGRAQVVLSHLPQFKDYSLFTDLDSLIDRLIRTEKRYRLG
jgi:hypothetical protein